MTRPSVHKAWDKDRFVDKTTVTTGLSRELLRVEQRRKEAVEQVDSLVYWMDELLRLAKELQKDLKRCYEPVKGWPPHIQKLEGKTDYEAALEEAKKFLKGEKP